MLDLHPWTLEPAEAIQLQSALRQRLVLTWDGRKLRTVGGVDMSVKGQAARAAIVVLSYPELEPVEAVTADVPIAFPYIPGLLTFREGPAILAAWQRLEAQPDLLMFDGQGIAHPRGIGLAAHMGLWLKRPSIGVAKSWLYGVYTAPGSQRGDAAELRDPRQPDRVIGQVLRTRTDVKPVYVSPGHLIDVSHAVELVLACCTRYRLPEPTRRAHQAAGGQKLTLKV
jgi:deoxyribonuclease V